VVVVGKIIIDQYGDPSKRSKLDLPTLTVGGGGPQAAWGAAAAIAVRDHFFGDDTSQQTNLVSELPPKQPITFMAPIGLKNWSSQHAKALETLLSDVLDVSPILVESEAHITPTINIWHDENELQKWHPVDGSFDSIGADELWRNRPSADDILTALPDNSDSIVLHCILESGYNAAGKGNDSLFLDNSELLSKSFVLGIEPIVFPDDKTLKVSNGDGENVRRLVRRARNQMHDKLLIVTPDRACFDSAFVDEDSCIDTSTEIVVRDGANGSFINQHQIPSATLQTLNGKPINPTGAGNAYSAAYVACRGTGSTPKEAAVMATAVGAVVCEYEHLPDWSWDVLERIAEAAKEVDAKLLNKSIPLM
jgi:hypothetical protein